MAKPLGATGEFFRRRDEWRKHPRLSNQLRHALPGFGLGVAAFGIYLVGEQVYNKLLAPSSSSSSSSHHSSHSSASH
ncbi:NADH dehydrogenase [ubiquinone] 1 beta subcomplex subunit 3-B-like [Ziziphus jujuba]|uniref:NADH dehydrogenase [ubiquinone] 1 beta subcomplex subunit 3-B-like n=1 Tax=Ziziphus jujuba TaxID=326968 RepID=A0A6P3Z7J7_ZIZJJ|nr:NADH dehydrogenase [ubiquinone] 1 beta subcomplex subunit 3-B-like [Ziziphus jujuba]